VLLSIVFISLGTIEPPEDLLLVIGGWLMLAWFGASLGLTLGAATAYSELVDRIWHPTSYLLFPLSGAAFMVEWLPKTGQEIILLLPMVHGVEIVREGFFGNTVRTHHDAGYMAVCCLVLNLIGLFLTRDAGRRVEAP
jgi:ABC-type polysaccharide/polyol phosphate export permease